MARPRQPVELVRVKGRKNLTKSEIKERLSSEVKANTDLIEPPPYLPDDLKDEFNKIASELQDIQIMTNLDCEALARYVVSEKQYQKIVRKALRMGADNEDYERILNLQDKLFKMCRAAAGDLGLTISSRCKLAVPKKEEKKPESKFSKFGGA